MAIRKNKKRIDPRYFLHETTYRDLNETVGLEDNPDLSQDGFQTAKKPIPLCEI